jgi:hypothetical protein
MAKVKEIILSYSFPHFMAPFNFLVMSRFYTIAKVGVTTFDQTAKYLAAAWVQAGITY